MAKVELQWSSRRCKLRALSQRHLPVIVRTVNGYSGLNGIDQLSAGQVRQTLQLYRLYTSGHYVSVSVCLSVCLML